MILKLFYQSIEMLLNTINNSAGWIKTEEDMVYSFVHRQLIEEGGHDQLEKFMKIG